MKHVPKSIAVKSLRLDQQNPRLSQAGASQDATLRTMWTGKLGKKNLKLASVIADKGWDDLDPIVVEKTADGYTVLEGNRRVAALIALEHPDRVVSLLQSNDAVKLRSLAAAHAKRRPAAVRCLVSTRVDARPYIERRHGGEQGGAGSVKWSAAERQKFVATADKLPYGVQALDWLAFEGCLTASEREKVPVTTLTRILNNKEVRKRLGLNGSRGRLEPAGEPKAVAKAVKNVCTAISTKRFKVAEVYTAKLAIGFVESLVPNGISAVDATTDQRPTPDQTKPHPAAGAAGNATPPPDRRPVRAARYLVEPTFQIPPNCARLTHVRDELSRLELDRYPNACAALLRVFLELAVVRCLRRKGLTPKDRAKLPAWLEMCTTRLLAEQKLSEGEAQAALRWATREFMAGMTIAELNAYLHDPAHDPSPRDLVAGWNQIKSALRAMLDA